MAIYTEEDGVITCIKPDLTIDEVIKAQVEALQVPVVVSSCIKDNLLILNKTTKEEVK